MKISLIIITVFTFSFLHINTVFSQEIINLGEQVNSKYNEQNPVLSPDGKTLYFTRSNHPENIGGIHDEGDIWYSELNQDGSWSIAKNIGSPINNSFMNAVIGFDGNGASMFLQNHYREDGKKPKTQGISVSKRSGKKWSFPEEVSIKYFHNTSQHQSLSLAANGRILLMAIESYGSRGMEDIYASFLQSNGKWSEPINLGNTINTPYQEMTPWLAADNTTLFFASNGHAGEGSRDIFVSKRLDDTWKSWSAPKNIGKQVNSPGVELSYFIPKNSIYAYLSTTQNSDGYGDISKIRIKPEDIPIDTTKNTDSLQVPVAATVVPIVKQDSTNLIVNNKRNSTILSEEKDNENFFITIEGKVINENDKTPITATIIFKMKNTGEKIQIVSDNENGYYLAKLPAENDYQVEVSAPNFLNYETELSLLSATHAPSLEINYSLQPITIGTTVRLQNVLFERGKAALLKKSFNELDKVAKLLSDNPNIEIELAGHTDNQGNAKLNIKLSQDRVEKVKEYLIGKGIDKKRIQGKGYGGTKPIASNASEETRKLNRRVEFTIIKN